MPVLVVLAVVLAQTPAEVTHDFFPFQAAVTALGQLNHGRTTFGINVEAFYVRGKPLPGPKALSQREGWFVGVGAVGFLGATDLPDCPGAIRCAARRYAGLSSRIGWAFDDEPSDVAKETFLWPDSYVYLQGSALLGFERLPSAPLSPQQDATFAGARLELGLNSLILSRLMGKLALAAFSGGGDAAAVGALFGALMLLNHISFVAEWSSEALSPGGFRFGMSIGSGL